MRQHPPDSWEPAPAGSRPGSPSSFLKYWLLPLATLTDEEKNRAGMASPDWRASRRIYFTALLCVFYLIHLDSPRVPGSPRPLVEFLAALTACIRHLRGDPSVSLPPAVETLLTRPGRRFHPGPEEVRNALIPLLWNGRTPATVQSGMHAAYAAQQISLS